MRKRHSLGWPLTISIAIAAHVVAGAGDTRQQSQSGQPVFRTAVVAVPIDVRVIGRDGRPVTDLTSADFTVFEDDLRQPIVHFTRQVLAAQPPGPALRARPGPPVFDASPQNQRVFLIVLGAGSLLARGLAAPKSEVVPLVPEPSRALDGLLHLIRHRLLPQDQVAILAYNRASDLSADHEAVARVLEAFKTSEQAGVAALSRNSEAAAAEGRATSAFTPLPVADSTEGDLGFAEYVAARNRGTSDLENLRYGIRYLRYVEGEKHLVYVTANGMVRAMPGTLANQISGMSQDPQTLAATANDARVVLHVIQTGGIGVEPGEFLSPLPILQPRHLVAGQPYWGSGGSNPPETDPASPRAAASQPGWDRPALDASVPIPGMNARDLQALSDLRTIARLTGGHASIMTDAAAAVDRIDEHTRVNYLLAYYPANSAVDGRYRSIKVEVNRPDVTVLYRHGYYGTQATGGLDRRAVVADGNLIAAASSTRQRRDIRLTVTPSFKRAAKGKGGEIAVQMLIDVSRVAWATDDLSRRVAHLDLAVFCADAKERTVGQTRRSLDVALTEARFAQVSAEGLPYSVRIPVTAPASYVKVVVYNLESNLAGSEVVKIK